MTLLSLLFLEGCEVGHRDYQYVVKHSAESSDSILLTYSLNGKMELQQKWLKWGDTLLICRNDVAGDDIWNIETSAVMLAIPSMVATSGDSSRMTEQLSQRIFWPAQPKNQNGVGVYELQITDDLFVLEKQWHAYHIHNKTNDTLFVTSTLLGESRRRDTVPKGETGDILSAKIFAYNDTLQGTDKYIEKKLSGIVSLSIMYKEISTKKEISKNIDLKKPHLYKWDIERTKSTLNVDESVFK